jgi:hypothetical protein
MQQGAAVVLQATAAVLQGTAAMLGERYCGAAGGCCCGT